MNIPKQIPFHEVSISSLNSNTSLNNTIVSDSNTNSKLLGMILISLTLIAVGGYIYYSLRKQQKKKANNENNIE